MPSVAERPKADLNDSFRAEPVDIGETQITKLPDAPKPILNGHVSPNTATANGIVLESIGDTLKTKSKWEKRLADEKEKEEQAKLRPTVTKAPRPASVGPLLGQWPPPEAAPELQRELSPIPSGNSELAGLEKPLVLTAIDKIEESAGHLSPIVVPKVVLPAAPATASERKPKPTSIASPTASDLEQQKTLMMLYMHYRSDVISSLGLEIPLAIKARMSQLAQRLPYRAALREESVYEQVQVSPDSQSPHVPGYPSNQTKETRYAKNPKGQTAKKVPHGRRFSTDPAPAPIPVIRPAQQEDMGQLSPGETIVAREIVEAEERESELRRSRSEMGLPSLEEVLDFWRNQEPIPHHPIRPVRSYDHLLTELQSEKGSSIASKPVAVGSKGRSSSLTHLHHEGHSPRMLSPVQSEQQRAIPAYVPPMRANTLPKQQPTHMLVSPTGRYESYDGRQIAEVAPTYRHTTRSFVPVEARIEAEVEDLRKREEELRRQRFSVGNEVSVVRVGMQDGQPIPMNGDDHEYEFHHQHDHARHYKPVSHGETHYTIDAEAWNEVGQVTMDSRISINPSYFN